MIRRYFEDKPAQLSEGKFSKLQVSEITCKKTNMIKIAQSVVNCYQYTSPWKFEK